MGAGGDVFKHLEGHLIAWYVGDLITILGPRDGNLPPEIQSERWMHVWLSCKTFPVFHIIFENYLYMRYSCVYVPKGLGGGGGGVVVVYGQSNWWEHEARFPKPLPYL